MSLVQHSGISAPTDPTATLALDLNTFEAALDDQQKRVYREQASKPDASAVVRFVSQLDRESSGRAGRCVASRLCTFLEATQQFSDVVETFVSSNPTLAALVWGGIKTAILAASNVASYFEKVSHFLMTIGRTCPTYQQFGSLYSDDVDLQKTLCEYYAVVVRLCTRVVEVSQRSALAQLFLPIITPFETEFSSFREDLNQAASAVQMSVSLASKKVAFEASRLVKLERKDNSTHRQRSSLFQKQSKQQQDEAHHHRLRVMRRKTFKVREKIRANLAPIDTVKTWRVSLQQRVHGTAIWYESDPQFCDWLADSKSSVLWCSGTLGTGKTVLTSSVIAHLQARGESSSIVSYFFCRSEEELSLRGRNILGSIACQLLDPFIKSLGGMDLENISERSHILDVADVTDLLTSNLRSSYTYFVILDGLDECDIENLTVVSEALYELSQREDTCVKIFCSGRPELETKLFHSTRPSCRLALKGEAVTKDIKTYVSTTLNQRLLEENLVMGDPMLIMRIAKALEIGARGMFLWSRLLLDEVCSKNSDKEIIAILDDFPTELAELFSRVLRRVTLRPNASQAIKVFQFCVIAKRPLSIEELQEALSIERGQQRLDRQALPNDMARILDDCCGLIFVHEEDNTVHLVHDSVKRHLFRGDANFDSATFQESVLNKDLGILCMIYLNFEDFHKQLMRRVPTMTRAIDPIGISLSAIRGQNPLRTKLAQLLLQRRYEMTDQDDERTMQQVLSTLGGQKQESPAQASQFFFLPYSQKYWIYHLNDLEQDDMILWKMFCKCVESEHIPAHRPWITNPSTDAKLLKWSDEYSQWAINGYHLALVRYSLSQGSYQMSETVRQTALIEFAAHGKTKLVDLMFTTPSWVRDRESGSFYNGAESVIKTFVAAAGRGHLDTVEMILAHQTDDGRKFHSNAPTALKAAARGGHADVVERSILAEADVNVRDEDYFGADTGQTALRAAAEGGHLDVIERLLLAGANVNAPGVAYTGRTALQEAASEGHLDVVERLLLAGADVGAPGAVIRGRTALQAAAERGHLDMVNKLLLAGASVNAAPGPSYGRTAIEAARMENHGAVVQRLKEAGAIE